MRMSLRRAAVLALLVAFSVGLGCDSGVPATGTGGNPASGGAVSASGGDSSTGGTAPDGGTSGSSGGAAAGGASGGAPSGGSGGASGGGTSDGGSGGSVTELRTFVYVGSGDWGDAEPGLVTVYELDRESLTLSYVSEHPAGGLASYLAIDAARLRLFAADEADGGLNSFTIDPATGELMSLGATASSNHPVYLWATTDGAHVLAANYNEGSVDLYPIDSAGKAGASLGATPTGEQAHCVVVDEDDHIFVPNKGADTISLLAFGSGLPLVPGPDVALPSPRHAVLHEGRAYVVSEEHDLITAYDIEADGALTYLWDVPRLPEGEGTAATDTGADIRVTPSGAFLYATNRGTSNTVVAYDLRTEPPTLLEHESSLGTTPRNFAMDPEGEFIIVANHGSEKTLVIFGIGADGHLSAETPLELDYSPYFVGIAQLP